MDRVTPSVQPLWLALHFPLFPLEIFPERRSGAVIIDKDRVVVGDELATDAGVMPGMRVSSAWGLMPDMQILERDVEAERGFLNDLACWAGGFTPNINLVLPDMLLLEIGGCLRLFGGIRSLRELVMRGAEAQGFVVRSAIAPAPLAAEWFARSAVHVQCRNTQNLRLYLEPIPLRGIFAESAYLKLFDAWGVRTLGDVLKQPTDGLARRLGSAFVLNLFKALGEVPDVRPMFVFPERFERRLELPAPVSHAQALVFAAQRLVAPLAGWLSVRVSGVRECSLILEHRDPPETVISLGFAEPVHHAERIALLLRERLERHALTSPVEWIRLRADRVEPIAATSAALFGATVPEATVGEILERIRARLGIETVQGLQSVAEHRPECATRYAMDGLADAPVSDLPRPLWLLPEPQALREERGRPATRDGGLRLLGNAERIESGWWDQDESAAPGDVRRDYFVALSPLGQLVWIFRDQTGWWLHGMFG